MEAYETGGIFVLAIGLVEIIKTLIARRKSGNGATIQPPLPPPDLDHKQDVKLCDEKHIHLNEKLADIKKVGDDNNSLLMALPARFTAIESAMKKE
jgi:hypothetical protein